MAAANVRYRCIYYNTTGDEVVWTFEILDTEPVAQVINIATLQPVESSEGVTRDFKPGVFPTTLSVGVYLRSTPRTIKGITYGVSIDLITDISNSAEGRFLARYWKGESLQFVGPIIYDQCSYGEGQEPVLMQITAVDGMARWGVTDYVSEVGQIVYESQTERVFGWDTVPLIYAGLSTVPLVIEHSVEYVGIGFYRLTTTFAYRSVYAKNSPGPGWVWQGGGVWHKLLTYTNQVITEETDVSYHLTRDINDDKHRTIAEYISRAMQETRMTDEYPDPLVMYDCSSEWYEHSMADFVSDPFTMERLHEAPLIGGTWLDAMQEIARTKWMRIYYSNGRYHFEQLSVRSGTTFKRHIYKSDGTSAGAAETASLDLDFNTLNILPDPGITNKWLAPFRLVEAFIQLDRNNLLEGVRWEPGKYGMRYLGRVKRVEGVQVMSITLGHSLTSTFSPAVLALLDTALINLVCKHKIKVSVQVRLTDVGTGLIYYMSGPSSPNAWSLTPYTHERYTQFGWSGNNTLFSTTAYGHTFNIPSVFLSEDLPGPAGTMYDVHFSVDFSVEWDNVVGATFWDSIHPNAHWHQLSSNFAGGPNHSNSLIFIDNSVIPFVEITDTVSQGKTYYRENDVANSTRVRIESQWGDTAQFEKGIQIYDGTKWISSSAWSVNGAGDPMELLELLVHEIISFRSVPRRYITGTFLSSLPNAESRFQKLSSYFLPMACSKNTDMDGWQGQFVEVARTTPPDGVIVSDPTDGEPLPGLTGLGDNSPDSPIPTPPITFETDEVITGGVSITEVDILNTSGVFIQAGTRVQIMDPTDGTYEYVTLTQDVNPGDTVMYFNAYMFIHTYPDASLIIPIIDDGLFPTSLSEEFYFFKEGYSASEIYAPAYTFPDPEMYGAHDINKRIKVFRNGIRIHYNAAPGSSPTKRKNSYYYDADLKKFLFWIPLSDETIMIKAT